jgi:glucosamine 6-phosphate synthetase-like amidotransferase/phosphosugar isomerase protein
MSKLNKFMRPTVEFDVMNRQHRTWAYEALQTSTWGRIPVRFSVSEEALNIQYTIERQLLEYYIGREFKKPVDKPAKKQYNSIVGKMSNTLGILTI